VNIRMEKKLEKSAPKQLDQPKVAIVVISWNSLDDVVGCLKSVHQMDYPNYEIVIVDNASTDGSPETIKQLFLDSILLQNKRNLGSTGGNNAGLRYAVKNGFQYVLQLNADVVLEVNTLTDLVSKAEKNPRLGLLSPALHYYNSPKKVQYCGSTLNWDAFTENHFDNPKDLENVSPNDFWIWGTSMLIKCDLIKKIGYYKENYFAYCEDIDYSLRAQKAGYKVEVFTAIHVYHKSHNIDQGGRANLPLHWFFYITRNGYWFWKENISGLKRFKLLRRYLAKIFDHVGHCKANGQIEVIDAYLDGLYCSLRCIDGEWDKTIKMPKLFSKIITLCPFFWADFLEGRFKKIINSIFEKIRGKEEN